MRDILTFVGGVVILILVAAVIAPLMIDWEVRRGLIENVLSEAVGASVETAGRLDVRFLPSPRLTVEHLRMRSPETAETGVTLAADRVNAEIALTPLLSGDVRFLEARAGRLEFQIRAPIRNGGIARVLGGLPLSSQETLQQWTVENLAVEQLFLTVTDTSTGTINQVGAQAVQISGQKLKGPWTIQGIRDDTPFRLTTGELSAARTLAVKLVSGNVFKLEADALVDLNTDNGRLPSASGTLKSSTATDVKAGTEPAAFPIQATAAFKTEGGTISFNDIALESSGVLPVRLGGTGRLANGVLVFDLQAMRLDAGPILSIAQDDRVLERIRPILADLLERSASWPIRIEPELHVETLTAGDDEIRNLSLNLAFAGGQLANGRAMMTLPGETAIDIKTEAGTVGWYGRFNGKVETPATLFRFLSHFFAFTGQKDSVLKAVDNLPGAVSTNFAIAGKALSLSDLNITVAGGSLGGSVFYHSGSAQAAPKVNAQLMAHGFRIDDSAQLSPLVHALRGFDADLALEATDLVYNTYEPVGTISIRIVSKDRILTVNSLDINGFAGAEAHLSGTIDANGLSRWSGTIAADRAAPLLDLFGKAWMGGAVALVPQAIKDEAINLRIANTQTAGTEPDSSEQLRTTISGTLAGGRFEGETISTGGHLQTFNFRLDGTLKSETTESSPVDVSAVRTMHLALLGNRAANSVLNVTVSGDIAGMALSNRTPFVLAPGDDTVTGGEIALETSNLKLAAAVFGLTTLKGPDIPAHAVLRLTQENGQTLVTLSANVNGETGEARIVNPLQPGMTGAISIKRLSMPWLLDTLVLNADANGRFGIRPNLPEGGPFIVKAATLDLGGGINASESELKLLFDQRGLHIDSLNARHHGGTVSGALSVVRDGGLATLTGDLAFHTMRLSSLTAERFTGEGTLSLDLKLGASAETAAGLINNLGGAGTASISGANLFGADPQGLERVVALALKDSASLSEGRLTDLTRRELAHGPFLAAPSATSVAVSGGVLKATLLHLDNPYAVWSGSASFDVRSMTFDARGLLTVKALPLGWTGAAPAIGFSLGNTNGQWSSALDITTLQNGIAGIMLQREVERTDRMEAEIRAHQAKIERERLERMRAEERHRQQENAPAPVDSAPPPLPLNTLAPNSQ